MLCRIYVKEKDFIRAIKKKIEIDRIVANDKYTNESTRQYVMYYTFGLLPRDVIIENPRSFTMPQPERIVISEVAPTIRRNFLMRIPTA